MNKTYYVYIHTNKINGKKYVGITSQEPHCRWRNGEGYKHHQSKFYGAIKKYGWDSFDHEVISEGLTLEEACELEVSLIQKYDSAHRDKGYNTDLGGKHSEWTEERRNSIKGPNNSMYGKTPWNKGLPKEQSPVFGRKRTEAEKKAIGLKNSGVNNGMYGKTPKNARKVRCVEKDLIFDSLYSAGTWLGREGRHRGDLISVHIKKGTIFYGYHWEYVE